MTLILFTLSQVDLCLITPLSRQPSHLARQLVREMEAPSKPSMSLFDVFLRLRPPHTLSSDERFLEVDEHCNGVSTHITIKPPTNDFRKRATERFGFSKVFEENATQLDVFHETESLIRGVLGQEGKDGKDGLLATLGVTGSGKV
jgi:hypothetical protein